MRDKQGVIKKSFSTARVLSLILVCALENSIERTGAQIPMAVTKPNIVLIMTDDMGYESVGAYGGRTYRTPTLDQLAARGMRFEHAYAQPLCTPS
jgi:hypothetical protein